MAQHQIAELYENLVRKRHLNASLKEIDFEQFTANRDFEIGHDQTGGKQEQGQISINIDVLTTCKII